VDAIGRDAIDTELEGGRKEERRVEAKDRVDHGAKRAQSITEEGGDKEED
jgi:hypothetical protein